MRGLSDYSINAEACAYCAKCHFGCPTYESTLQEGHSARGKVQIAGAVAASEPFQAAILRDSKKLQEYLDFCLRCYHCLDVCPAHIATVPIFEALRFETARVRPPSLPLQFLTRTVLPNRRLTRLGAGAGAAAGSLIPFLVKRVQQTPRLIASLADMSLATRPASLNNYLGAIPVLGQQFSIPSGKRLRQDCLDYVLSAQVIAEPLLGSIGYFLDCLTDIYYPAAFAGTVRFLNANGYRVVIQPEVGCCGASALNTGDEKAFARMARAYAMAFDGAHFSRILFSNPTCYKTVKERYGKALGSEADNLPEPVLDVEMFAQLPPPILHPAWKNITVAWHNPCALGMALGDKTTGANVLRKWGLQVADVQAAEECCGYGGLFSQRYPKFASELSAKKLLVWQKAGVDLVLSCSSGCINHLNSTAATKGIPLPTIHWGELL